MMPRWERYAGVPIIFRVIEEEPLRWADWWSYVVLPC